MKKIILALIFILSFAIAKANSHSDLTQRIITVSGINSLKNYEVEFKFFPQKKYVFGPAPLALAFQNKLALEKTQASIIPSTIRKNKNGFVFLKLVA